MNHNVKDITGERFGRLTVIEPTEKRHNRCVIWLCRCDCGNLIEVQGSYLRVGDTMSCGCLHSEKSSERAKALMRTHGGCHDRLFRVWTGMISRCTNPNSAPYKNYGGRGIKICDEWRHSYQSFKDWAYSNGYDDKALRGECTIDRIDVNGNYCPENCRFIPLSEQSKNTTKTRLITVNGETRCVSDWARCLGVSDGAIYRAERISGIPAEDYIKYRLLHNGERYIRAKDVLDFAAAEKWK